MCMRYVWMDILLTDYFLFYWEIKLFRASWYILYLQRRGIVKLPISRLRNIASGTKYKFLIFKILSHRTRLYTKFLILKAWINIRKRQCNERKKNYINSFLQKVIINLCKFLTIIIRICALLVATKTHRSFGPLYRCLNNQEDT